MKSTLLSQDGATAVESEDLVNAWVENDDSAEDESNFIPFATLFRRSILLERRFQSRN